MNLPEPPYSAADQLVATLVEHQVAVLEPVQTAKALGLSLDELLAWTPEWMHLPIDRHMKDGGRYRKRRHASYVVSGDDVQHVAHRAHWQPLDYNALHGGMTRWFDPIEPHLAEHPSWLHMLRQLGQLLSSAQAQSHPHTPETGVQPWFVEAHQFRIDTEGGIGRPTPEGAHRDGVDYVVIFLVERRNVMGGESRVFESYGCKGERFTLMHPWTMLVLDDHQVIHETTPIRPLGEGAFRDTLVLTYRRHSFQDADQPLTQEA